jgi:hypothetical protein
MGKCYALLRMRPLSISRAEGFVVISCGKSIMKNLAGETIDARSRLAEGFFECGFNWVF